MASSAAWEKAWGDVQSLRPIVEAHRDEADELRRLPDPIAKAFVERDVYRLMLPEDMGGAGLDPLQHFDLSLEVAKLDASVAWNYSLAMSGVMVAGALSPDMATDLFATPECSGAGAGAPQGRAVPAEGGYRVSGRWAWASGINQAHHITAGCIVFDGDQMKIGPNGKPLLMHILVPIEDVTVFDTWHTGGMRGTGSTEFMLDDVFVPDERTFQLFSGRPKLPHALFKLPTSFFGFGLSAVPLGVALSTIEVLQELAKEKRLSPQRMMLSEHPSIHYTVAKAQMMVEAAIAGTRSACERVWDQVCSDGEATMENRARLRGSMVHAVDTGIEAVTMCYRAAGGSAVFRAAPFERALRDVQTIGAHTVFQRLTMEDVGRLMFGLEPYSGMF